MGFFPDSMCFIVASYVQIGNVRNSWEFLTWEFPGSSHKFPIVLHSYSQAQDTCFCSFLCKSDNWVQMRSQNCVGIPEKLLKFLGIPGNSWEFPEIPGALKFGKWNLWSIPQNDFLYFFKILVVSIFMHVSWNYARFLHFYRVKL